MSGDPTLATDVPVNPAATVMLLRDADSGLEVFMLQRSHSSAFARSQYVFPGGRVDGADAASEYEPICDGVTDASASQRLGLRSGGLAWLVAAIRECFEEAGVLLARRSDQADVIEFSDAEVAATFDTARTAVHDGELPLSQLCAEQDLQLLTDRMFLIDHWITPLGERRRFDTRFFVAAAPKRQVPLHDNSETIASLWTTASSALDQCARGELQMFPPTIACLRWLAGFGDVGEAIQAARATPVPRPIEPRLSVNGDNDVVGVVLPGEDGYDEVDLPTHIVGRFRD